MLNNKHALVFPLFIKSVTDTSYYAMAYYALETLFLTGYNNEFDIILYYGCDYDIYNHKHFAGGQNIFKDFEGVNFIRGDFHKNLNDVYLFKWDCVDHLIKNFYNYVKLFILDVDVIFYSNPASMFNKYDDYHAFILFENSDEAIKKVLGRNGIAAGQLLISRDLVKNISWFDNVYRHKQRLVSISRSVLFNDSDLKRFEILSEMYAVMHTMEDAGLSFKAFDIRDILYGDTAYMFYLQNQDICIHSNTNILHYFGSRAHLFLPHYLRNADMNAKLRAYIKAKSQIN